MDILLAEPRGYCAGVVRAVDIVELALTKIGNPIYVRHEIIHNQHVVNELKDKGAIFVEEISEIPENSTVIFSAHGVSPLVWEEAQKKNLNIIDATCPLVTKVHLEAIKYAKDGYTILLVGHKGHDEVIGTMGEAPDNTILVESVEDIPLLNIPNSEKVVALTQTTLSVSDTANIISALKEKFPKLVTRNDICYATTNRQNALDSITDDVDLVLVVGAKNSSNSNRLKELASETSRLAKAAREGILGLDDYAEGTFTVSALGMYGVDSFTPIINQPQSGIMGVNRLYDGMDWEEERIVKSKKMNLSLTWDHRALDGAPAAEFLVEVKNLLEAPYRLLV